MSEGWQSGGRAALLWAIAAALALIASGIAFLGDGETNWGSAASGVFCAAMAVSAWMRRRRRS